LRMTWILRPATVSPCSCMYRRTALSICLPVEAKGPVMGRIRPILKASWAVVMPAHPIAAHSNRLLVKVRLFMMSPSYLTGLARHALQHFGRICWQQMVYRTVTICQEARGSY